jgi:leucyl/phenylalanyl-tRNA--protein transferase
MPVVKLTPSLLVSAYAQGIFPMDVDGSIEWFSPDPRAILPLDHFIVTKTLAQVCRRGTFQIRVNTAFLEVMRRCAERDEGTWISREIIDAYCELHRRGLAHSVEAWKEGALAGGLYGVSLGGAFFGESMFHRVRDASKVALVALVERLRNKGFSLLDVQFMTEHLRRFGAVDISRRTYLRRLDSAIRRPCRFDD